MTTTNVKTLNNIIRRAGLTKPLHFPPFGLLPSWRCLTSGKWGSRYSTRVYFDGGMQTFRKVEFRVRKDKSKPFYVKTLEKRKISIDAKSHFARIATGLNEPRRLRDLFPEVVLESEFKNFGEVLLTMMDFRKPESFDLLHSESESFGHQVRDFVLGNPSTVIMYPELPIEDQIEIYDRHPDWVLHAWNPRDEIMERYNHLFGLAEAGVL